jgi:4-diphosphocytidyl-2-C-methyl-D-erythritol kinase
VNGLSFETPSKINLFLQVLGRREDGYHEILTEMVMISLSDRLTVRTGVDGEDSDRLTLSGRAIDGVPDDNLVLRAFRIFREASSGEHGSSRPVPVFVADLEKRIPVGAGLGGGSGNAAGALWAANALSGSPLAREVLEKLASKLGSDVPFFLGSPHSAAFGRGERIRSLPPFPARTVLVWNPGFTVPTRDVYQKLDAKPVSLLTEDECIHRINSLLSDGFRGNDLERVTMDMHPVLGEAKECLRAGGAEPVLMSGSGPSLFGIFPEIQAAERVRQEIVEHLGGWAGVFHTLDSSPFAP